MNISQNDLLLMGFTKDEYNYYLLRISHTYTDIEILVWKDGDGDQMDDFFTCQISVENGKNTLSGRVDTLIDIMGMLSDVMVQVGKKIKQKELMGVIGI